MDDLDINPAGGGSDTTIDLPGGARIRLDGFTSTTWTRTTSCSTRVSSTALPAAIP